MEGANNQLTSGKWNDASLIDPDGSGKIIGPISTQAATLSQRATQIPNTGDGLCIALRLLNLADRVFRHTLSAWKEPRVAFK
jgi:hypothetical protein